MKFVNPSFDILTEISCGGIKELKHIERCARVSYRSENKISEDGESAKKMVGKLIENGHESCLEHGSLTVEFTCDRAIANELVRHRVASFTQESTRYVRADAERIGGDVTYILPHYLKRGYDLYEMLKEMAVHDDEFNKKIDALDYPSKDLVFAYINFKYGGAGGMDEKDWDDICKFYSYLSVAEYSSESYKASVKSVGESTPEEARWMLPLGLATRIVVTANYREWRHIFKLRCEKHAHPEMRRIMIPLCLVLMSEIPVVFDDLKNIIDESLKDDAHAMADRVLMMREYYRKKLEVGDDE